MPRKELHEDNRRSWNAATVVHNSHKADQARFLLDGGDTLFDTELELLGDIAGRSLVHLQCNSGQDTLCLARRGATVTGVDISDEAIAFARQLSSDTGIPATFVRADVYDWLAEAAQQTVRYDIAFSSYGALVWLSDIRAWAQGIAAILKPGGRLVVVEFHPFAMTFDWDWSHKFPYFTEGNPLSFESGVGDYVALSGEALAPSGYIETTEKWVNPHPGHEFVWGIGEIVTALLDAGLTLTTLHEYPYSNAAKLFERMRELPGKRMVPPEDVPNVPLMFAFAARRGLG